MVELADRLRAYVANLARDIGERSVFLSKALHFIQLGAAMVYGSLSYAG